MLKKIRVLFLGLMVLAGSACVTPTHASSAQSVILWYVQAAGPSGAKEELIVIYNNGSVEADVTGWCLANKSAVLFACFSNEENTRFILPAYSSATFASHEYLTTRALANEAVAVPYEVTSQSSGSLVNSSDTISLIDGAGEVVDSYTWTGGPPSGKGWARILLLSGPNVYAVGNDGADWMSLTWVTVPLNTIETRITQPEQPEDPGEEEDDPELEVPTSPLSSPIRITEILANASGSDLGNEFIELHNPTESDQSLNGLKLRLGLDTAKWYSLPTDVVIPGHGFLVVSDDELGFTLVNTNGGVQLYDGETELGDRIEYSSPKDNMAWALIDEEWKYTAQLTPGSLNVFLAEIEAEKESETEEKPCASNQFRNPETGRCKLLSTTTSTQTPCKEGQERNPETNRCRNIVVASTPTPCKEGQERNVETNRCRTITKMSDANFGVQGIQAKADSGLAWYYWAGIAGAILLVLGYALWEWREELKRVWQRLQARFAK